MDSWLVVGLGNPGRGYSGNRHNIGAMVIDELCRRHGGELTRHKVRASVATVRLGVDVSGAPGPRAILAIPRSYMNESGGAVAGLVSYYSLDLERTIIVHDELDLPFDTVRLKRGGGEGGHNGLRSISRSCGTRDYLRVRVGIGRPPGRMEAANYVLKDFSSLERPDLPLLIGGAADAVEALVDVGLAEAQQRFHARLAP